MKHTSIKLDTPCEFINIVSINPLISKCQIKVCYVSDEPNRNKSIITKATAEKMAQSLPGSPIVGFYNENNEDFEEHNKSIDVSNGKFVLKDDTFPYGFVDLGAKVWFQKFLDDDKDEREYLMTEGYLWTGQYPEAQRVIEKGNNQSMELDKNLIDATWTKDDNGQPQFFIINEAIISKLCILGEECEPCFEGASIGKVEFSFDDNFKQELHSMIEQVSELLKKEEGGEKEMFNTFAVEIGDSLFCALMGYMRATFPGEDEWCSRYTLDGVFEEANGDKFAVLKDPKSAKYYRLNFSMTEENGFVPAEEVVEVTVSYTPAAEPQFALEDYEAYEAEFKKQQNDKKKDEEENSAEEKPAEDKSSDDSSKESEDTKDSEEKDDSAEEKPAEDKASEEDEEEKKKKKYSLDEEEYENLKNSYNLEDISEYVELSKNYIKLESEFKALADEKEELIKEVNELKEFKLSTDRKEKEKMICETFYMLSDEEKAEVKENIDKYSLDEIEAKLSVICVRNKIFNLDADKNEEKKDEPLAFSLTEDLNDNGTPAWVSAAIEVAKSLN